LDKRAVCNDNPSVSLQICRVVLFKHGVGYFERQGDVQGDVAVDLHFKASEMNDVLKSLTVLDLADGHVASISYESTLPTEKRLEEIAFRLPDGSSLSGLLEQLKGARVEVEIGSQSVVGTVAGLETEWRRVDRENYSSHRLVLMGDDAAMRAFDLQELKQVRLLDENVKKDLQHLLEVSIGSKKKDVKRLTIFGRGKGKRPLVVSYVVETPVWKASYRMLLSAEASSIQGWALIDNTQDEDWTDVQLSLVAGLPVSFVHDLYSPRYRKRPEVVVAQEEAYAPPLVEEMLYPSAAAEVAVSAGGPPPAGMPPPRAAPAPAPQRRSRSAAMVQSTKVETRTTKVGDLFEYAIERPVTVKRGESALVPIVSSAFKSKRVVLYNRDTREENPLSAVLFENTTGLTLEGGPVTVLEGDRYLGESMLELVKPGDERIVPFSVELACSVTLDHESGLSAVQRTKIAGGVLELHKFRELTTVYRIHNKSDSALDFFLDHRFQRGYQLTDTPDPIAVTENYNRFRFSVPASSEHAFAVKERGDERQTVGLATLTREQVEVWVDSKTIDPATRAALEEILALNDLARELNSVLVRQEHEVKRIQENQKRVRQNLQSLGDSKDERSLRERYVLELGQEEDALKELSTATTQTQRERERLLADLQKKVRELSFESR
jgi:hypothetical protein